jgi:hypothetical protein
MKIASWNGVTTADMNDLINAIKGPTRLPEATDPLGEFDIFAELFGVGYDEREELEKVVKHDLRLRLRNRKTRLISELNSPREWAEKLTTDIFLTLWAYLEALETGKDFTGESYIGAGVNRLITTGSGEDKLISFLEIVHDMNAFFDEQIRYASWVDPRHFDNTFNALLNDGNALLEIVQEQEAVNAAIEELAESLGAENENEASAPDEIVFVIEIELPFAEKEDDFEDALAAELDAFFYGQEQKEFHAGAQRLLDAILFDGEKADESEDRDDLGYPFERGNLADANYAAGYQAGFEAAVEQGVDDAKAAVEDSLVTVTVFRTDSVTVHKFNSQTEARIFAANVLRGNTGEGFTDVTQVTIKPALVG